MNQFVKHSLSLALLVIAPALAFAQDPASGSVAPVEASFEELKARPATTIFGRSFVIDEVAGQPVEDPANASMVFIRGGRFAGYSGCNHYGGPGVVGEGTLVLKWFTQSFDECPEPVMALEEQFHVALREMRHWRLDQDFNIHLYDEGGELLMRGHLHRPTYSDPTRENPTDEND